MQPHHLWTSRNRKTINHFYHRHWSVLMGNGFKDLFVILVCHRLYWLSFTAQLTTAQFKWSIRCSRWRAHWCYDVIATSVSRRLQACRAHDVLSSSLKSLNRNLESAWAGDRPFSRPQTAGVNTDSERSKTTFMPRMGFEHMIRMFQELKAENV